MPLEEGDTIDAVVKISAFGKIKHTDPIDDVGGNALVA